MCKKQRIQNPTLSQKAVYGHFHLFDYYFVNLRSIKFCMINLLQLRETFFI